MFSSLYGVVWKAAY